MKIVFTSTGKSWDSPIDPRFGRAEYLAIYDESSDTFSIVENSEVTSKAHGAGPYTAQKMVELKPDILITGNGPGDNAAQILKRLNLKLYVNAHNWTVKEAYEQYKAGKLENFPL